MRRLTVHMSSNYHTSCLDLITVLCTGKHEKMSPEAECDIKYSSLNEYFANIKHKVLFKTPVYLPHIKFGVY